MNQIIADDHVHGCFHWMWKPTAPSQVAESNGAEAAGFSAPSQPAEANGAEADDFCNATSGRQSTADLCFKRKLPMIRKALLTSVAESQCQQKSLYFSVSLQRRMACAKESRAPLAIWGA